ncbi:MAG TPA: molybdopterin-dependent oxidoreductase [Gammaproteobacteria bacterium]|nr:molybdopterin-dependent oxidoreductase [Gammaproteobacteria bacterium]
MGESAQTVRTICPYCGVGCGVEVATAGDSVIVRGDKSHPANLGRLCSKGAALPDTLSLDGRLLHPEVGGERVDWDTALDKVAGGIAGVIARHGPEAVAFYVSGQLLTEDYYVANKLMKGFLGSANIDTNSRLCMSSAVAGHQRALGADCVPGCYEDLELADLVVITGSNLAWCHPVIYQRIARAKRERPDMKVIVVDPRRTATCDIADLHLPLAPGSDVLLFNGLLNYLRRTDALDWSFLEEHTSGFAQALQSARDCAGSIPAVADGCGLPEQSVAEFFHWFARTQKTVTLFSQGVNQSSSGVDKVNAIINCHLATGRIGRPGMGPFSMTGQPNAMGGREVGGLANQLAAHRAFDDAAALERVAGFWRAADMARKPGLKAVDLFEAVADGRIRAVWIMATNPAVSLPDADRVREALRVCELVIVSDCERDTDTTACADILLPAAAWGEKEGTVTNSERRISRQRAFRDAPGEARPDWWIVSEVARRLGHTEAFGYESAAEIFREHAALSGLLNGGADRTGHDFDISALASISDEEYAALQPVQWPVTAARGKGVRGTARLFGDGRFPSASGKARFVAVRPRPPVHLPEGGFPLVLNTGRVRDHWHTLTRTGKAARLSVHTVEPYVEMHPADAAARGLDEAMIAEVRSHWGCMRARVKITSGQREGSVFVPMHWSDRFAARARVDALVNPVTDPVSGQPESKHTPVEVSRWQAAWYGFVLTREPLPWDIKDDADYRVRARADGAWRYEIAGSEAFDDPALRARALIGRGLSEDDKDEWVEYHDAAQGRYRAAHLHGGRLEACVFIESRPQLPAREWLLALFAEQSLDESSRMALLSGRPPGGQGDAGRIICSCFGVGLNTLREAIANEGLTTPEAIGAALRAGTNCGSCIPELKTLIAECKDQNAA